MHYIPWLRLHNTLSGHEIIDTQYLDSEEAAAGAEALAEEGLFGGYTRRRTLYIIVAVRFKCLSGPHRTTIATWSRCGNILFTCILIKTIYRN